MGDEEDEKVQMKLKGQKMEGWNFHTSGRKTQTGVWTPAAANHQGASVSMFGKAAVF